MSAGFGRPGLKVNNDLTLLAPRFAKAVGDALVDCRSRGLDAIVYEAQRSQELQALYYARGRSIVPPHHTVTNAPSNLLSWHGYGLAVDVIHRTLFWKPDGGERWFADVADIFKQHGCRWGGDWTKPDHPHFQWHLCMPSPSQGARQLLLTQGRQAVWQALEAV